MIKSSTRFFAFKGDNSRVFVKPPKAKAIGIHRNCDTLLFGSLGHCWTLLELKQRGCIEITHEQANEILGGKPLTVS